MKKKHFLSIGLTVLSILMLALSIAQTRVNVSAASPPPKKVARLGPSATKSVQINGIAAVSANDVWAVGYHTFSSNYNETGIEQWNGTSWNVVPSPTPGQSAQLNSVVAVSPTDVWAVGYYEDSNGYYTLIEQWNGSTWNVVPSPTPGQNAARLYSVAAVSPTDVWAVGYYIDSNSNQDALIEQWNGTNWNVVPNPTPAQYYNGYLSSVTAVSANDVWAVGYIYNSSNNFQTLIEQWNGTSWNVVPSPSPGQAAQLNSVTAVSANDVWAVGYIYISSSDYQTLIEQWNGTSWNVVPSPSPGQIAQLNSVTAVSANDIWAVGFSENSAGITGPTLIEQWNGTSWKVVPSPNPSGSSGYDLLSSVTAVSATDVWAAGYDCTSLCTSSAPQTLIEQWNGSTWNVWPNITVQGAVSCTSHPLVGVWVKSSTGGSRFAGWSTSSSNGYDGIFSATISTALPTTLQLHVGCGGSTTSWWSNNWTPVVSVSGSVTLEASCNEGTIQPAKGSNSRCAFTTTSGESAAISWAEGQMANNPSGYYLQCLKFVFDAYEISSSKQINLHAMISPQPSSWPNTYPVQIWGHFNRGVTGTGTNPPPGALVFWKASNGVVQDSHAALSIGGGYVITTAYNKNPDIHKASMSQFPGAVELGWWLPA